jgi:hypothetical protein
LRLTVACRDKRNSSASLLNKYIDLIWSSHIREENTVEGTYHWVGITCNKIIDQTIREREYCWRWSPSRGGASGRIVLQRMGYYRCHLQSADGCYLAVRSTQYAVRLPRTAPPTPNSLSQPEWLATVLHTQVAELLNVIVITNGMYLFMISSPTVL